ncbi:MAG: PDZ domain-containing protein [Chitinophagales bacterium]|nr:PDZ domain-containing protein [Chitinophagales bacterium]
MNLHQYICCSFSSHIRWVVAYWILAAMIPCSAQVYPPQSTQPQGYTEIPFEYINGFIVIDVLFQQIYPMKFIFDTGAENSVLFNKDIALAFQLPCNNKVRLIGSNLNQEIIADICTEVYLKVANLHPQASSMIVLDDDYFFIEEFIGIKINGILGGNYFSDKIIKIDYIKMVITVIEPGKFKPSKYKKYHQYDIEIIDKKPYLPCKIAFTADTTFTERMLLDTGAGISAIFHHPIDTTIFGTSSWSRGVLGKGLSGDIEGYVGKIHRFRFGDFEFEQMISSFQWLSAAALKHEKIVRFGLIGNLILERFDVILDYPNKKLYLKATKQYKKPFEYDKSGLTIYAYGENLNQYYIKHVNEHSPAAMAGIQENDIILKINGFSYKWFTLKKINALMSQKTGKKVKLKLQRGQEILKKEIILKDLY